MATAEQTECDLVADLVMALRKVRGRLLDCEVGTAELARSDPGHHRDHIRNQVAAWAAELEAAARLADYLVAQLQELALSSRAAERRKAYEAGEARLVLAQQTLFGDSARVAPTD